MSDNQNHEAVEPVEDVDQEDADLTQDDEQVEETDTDQDQGSGDQSENDFDREAALNKIRKINAENRNLRKAKKEAEEKAGKVDPDRVAALEAKTARYETLAENGLPLQLAKWINATEADDILTQAEELLSLGSGGNNPPPTDTPKERVRKNRKQVTNADEIGDLDEFAAKIFND